MEKYLYANFFGMAQFRPGFSLPIIIKNLLIINALAFFATETFGPGGKLWATNMFALHDVRSVYFRPHQLVTHMFMHGSFTHLLFNMLAVWMFGSRLEYIWGPKRFLTFYMLSGLGAALLHMGTLYLELTPFFDALREASPQERELYLYDPTYPWNGATVGASGAVFGCLAAFAYLFPNEYILLYFVVPIKVKWFVLVYAGLELYLGLANTAGKSDGIAHWAHLGGALVGFLIVYFWNKNNRRRFY